MGESGALSAPPEKAKKKPKRGGCGEEYSEDSNEVSFLSHLDGG